MEYATHVKVDFSTLKTIPFAAVLERYGVKFKQPNKEYLRADCPLPSHTSKESKGSFAVNLARNIWCCKSTSCNEASRRKGGDVLDFVGLMENAPILDAAKKLLEWFPLEKVDLNPKRATNNDTKHTTKQIDEDHPTNGHNQESTPGSLPVLQENATNKPLGFELKGITYHAYLEARGISKDLAERFGVGFFPGKGSMSGRIVFPIKNEKGELVGYAGRAIDSSVESQPKYKLPPGFHKGHILYNRFAVKGEAVTIVEGFISCMKVSAAGFPCVALMGASLTEAQEKLLTFKYITLLLDPDDAGSKAAAEIAPRLARGHYVRIVTPPRQPDEMSSEEIKATLRMNGLCAI
jgi:DNA primase